MRHAGPRALDCVEPLLKELRKLDGVDERKRGVFYRGGRAFVHFHEDAAGIFADLRCGDEFVRYPVSTRGGAARLLRACKAGPPGGLASQPGGPASRGRP